MRRKIYFLIERLEIKRSERIAVTLLLITFVVLNTTALMIEPVPNYDESEYQKLTKIFHQKSNALQEEEDIILARYLPNRPSASPQNMQLDDEKKSEANPADTTKRDASSTDPDALININSATEEQLQQLPGIGPAYAGRIIEWRQENGAFTSKDQLLDIKGIGEKRLAKIKPHIRLE